MAEMDNKLLLGIFSLIAGAYAMIIKALFGNRNLVSKDDFEKHKESVVYKDTCKETRIAIETKISSVSEIQTTKLDNLEKKVDSGFSELKVLIKNHGKSG